MTYKGIGEYRAITLTTGLDTVSGTAADDVVNGVIAATSTLQIFDSIDGGAGTNSLNVNFANTAAANFDSTVSPTLNNIQIVNMNSMNGNMAFDGSIAPAMTTLNINNQGTTGIVTATKISGNVNTFGLSNVTTDDTDLVVTYAAGAMSGTADAVTLNLNNAKAETNTAVKSSNFELHGKSAGLGVESITVHTTGESRLGTLISEDNAAGNSVLNTLIFTGNSPVEIMNTLNFNDTTNLGTIDASQATAGVTVTVEGAVVGATETITFTGGSGNDRLNFGTAGAFTSADSVNFGTGTDTLGLTDATFTDALYSAVNGTGAEKVAFIGAGITADMSKLTPTTVVVDNNNGTNVFTKLAATDTVEVSTAMQAGGINLTASLGFNTANVKLMGTSSDDVDIATLNTTNQTTVNIDSVGTIATNDITTFTNTANTAINVTGSGKGLALGTLGASAVVTATSYTGETFSVAGANAASSFTTGSAADTITLGTVAGGDFVNTGAGNDIINTAVMTGVIATEITGGLGKDTITVVDFAFAVAGKMTVNATAAESYATANHYDTINFVNQTFAGGNETITVKTGLLSTSLTAATSVTVGTTTFAQAGGFIWVNATGSTTALNESASLYQDSNSNGVLDASDFRMDFALVGNDTLAVSLVGSQAVVSMTGVLA